MSREHMADGQGLGRLAEGQALGLDDPPDALQGQESAVALVHVAHRGADPERLERPHAPDARYDLLPDANLAVAPVEPGRDLLIVRAVLREVRVQQVQRHAADHGAPERDLDIVVAHLEGDVALRPVRAEGRLHRQVGEVILRVLLLLPTVDVEILPEVALLIQQAHGGHGDAEVAGALEVVAGKHGEAARVDRQAFGDAKLQAEVADPVPGGQGFVAVEPRLLEEVGVGLGDHPAQVFEEALIVRQRLEPLLRDLPQHRHRVVVGVLPRPAIHALEQLDGVLPPRPR